MPRAPVCPYYGRTKKENLVCLVGGADTTGTDELCMGFPSQMARVRYWVDHCCGDWESCSLAAALAGEYERQEQQPEPKKNPGASKVDRWLTEKGLRQLEDWVRGGKSPKQLAVAMGVTGVTLREWRRRYPEIAAALERGQQ